MSHAPITRLASAAAVVLVIAGVLGGCGTARHHAFVLEIISAQDGDILHAVPVRANETFEFTYVHSVSKSPVTGVFGVHADGKIQPIKTVFIAYGPGMPWAEDKYERGLDGSIQVWQTDAPARDELRIWVSTITQDTFAMHETTIALASVDRPTRLVVIRIRRA